MRIKSAIKPLVALAVVAMALGVAAQPAKADWWRGGGWGGPRFGIGVRIGGPGYGYYGHPWYPRGYYAPPVYYRPRPLYYGPRPYYYAPPVYYRAPVIGFGVNIR